MVDVFNPKEEEGTKEEIYKKHTYPSDEQIVRKVGEVREEWETRQPVERKLGRLYIATNGTQEETGKLKEALGKAGECDVIASTYDLVLDHEQQYIAYAVDSAIAERAGVFIDTGVSGSCLIFDLSGALTSDWRGSFFARIIVLDHVCKRQLHAYGPWTSS